MVITSFLISSSKVATVLLDTPVRNYIIFIIRTLRFFIPGLLIKSENKNKAFNSIYQFKIYSVRIGTILIPYH